MLTEHAAPTADPAPAAAPAPTAGRPAAAEANPIDPRLPPEAPMLMPAQEIRARVRDRLPGWLRAVRPSSGQAG